MFARWKLINWWPFAKNFWALGETADQVKRLIQFKPEFLRLIHQRLGQAPWRQSRLIWRTNDDDDDDDDDDDFFNIWNNVNFYFSLKD